MKNTLISTIFVIFVLFLSTSCSAKPDMQKLSEAERAEVKQFVLNHEPSYENRFYSLKENDRGVRINFSHSFCTKQGKEVSIYFNNIFTEVRSSSNVYPYDHTITVVRDAKTDTVLSVTASAGPDIDVANKFCSKF
jgi:hypothetical protein